MMAIVTIASLHVYPVKGCAAVDVESIHFDSAGLVVGDRIAMVVDASTGAFVSQRHLGSMARLRATFTDGPAPVMKFVWFDRQTAIFERPAEVRPMTVTVWDDTFLADDGGDDAARWLSEALSRSVRLVWLRGPSGRKIDPFWTGGAPLSTSFADLAPLLLTNVASLDALNARRIEANQGLIEMARFRPNLVVSGLPAFGEDAIAELHGVRARVGLIKPCARCSVIELDPSDGTSTGDEVLRSLALFRTLQNRRGTRGILFGQNAICLTPGGQLQAGERVEVVLRSPEVA